MSTSVPTWKRFDTFPPLVACLTSAGTFVDLSGATSVKIILKGTSVLVTGTCVVLPVVTPHGNLSLGSNAITNMSALTSIVAGSSVQGTGIPVGTRIGTIDGVNNIVYMVDQNNAPVNATQTGVAVTLTINVGTVQYNWASNDLAVADNYQNEFEVHWTVPSGAVETFPNDHYNTVVVVADLENV